jgi:mono/diheme cytochrome c family protein
MPQVLAKADDKTLVAIEHYLTSLRPKAATKAAAKIMHVNGARGGELFNTLGCVACHAPGKGFVPPEGLPKASASPSATSTPSTASIVSEPLFSTH